MYKKLINKDLLKYELHVDKGRKNPKVGVGLRTPERPSHGFAKKGACSLLQNTSGTAREVVSHFRTLCKSPVPGDHKPSRRAVGKVG